MGQRRLRALRCDASAKSGKTIGTHLKHYENSSNTESPDISVKKSEDACSDALKALFCSLVGALAWLTQTRIDIAAYVTALQRWGQAPRVEHAKRANRVLAYCSRKGGFLHGLQASRWRAIFKDTCDL